MDPNTERDEPRAQDDDTIRDGSLIIEERMNRREGLVEYEGTVGGTTAGERAQRGADAVPGEPSTGDTVGSAAMQAGATVLGGTGTTAMVDDAATVAGAPGDTAGGTGGASSADLDMSTDHTAAGHAASGTAAAGPISMVRQGMKVVDANGDDVGKVEFVKLGDPQAMTTAGQTMGPGEPLGDVWPLGGDEAPDLDEPLRSELLRSGYLKVDGKGWFGSDRYVPADQVADVSGDTVRLSVAKEETIEAP